MVDKNKKSNYLRFPDRTWMVRVCLLVLTVCFYSQHIHAQIDTNTVISEIINKYTKVLHTYYDSLDRVKVNDTSGFHVNDAVMIVQMKANSYSPNFLPDGESAHNHNISTAGQYEIIKIQQIRPSDSMIIFTTQLSLDLVGDLYDPAAFVQLIRVPIYKSVTVGPAGITCLPWIRIGEPEEF